MCGPFGSPTARVTAIVVATLLLVLSSAAGAADWKGTETTVDGTLHVKNPAEAIDPERVVVMWYGATNFIADNDTEEGRAQNRRVEIAIGMIGE